MNLIDDIDLSLEGLSYSSFINNDIEKGRNVAYEIKNLINNCDEFYFSVAFITYSGIEQIKGALKDFKELGKKARILTTNFNYVTEPKALKDLIDYFPNIEIRMFDVNKQNVNFHTKGYIFRSGEEYTCLIGSSNLTQSAITKNEEWNTLFKGDKTSSLIIDVLNEFENLFLKATPINEIINEYESKYNEEKEKHKNLIIKEENNFKLIKPNKMQIDFINSLNSLIEKGEKRALLISATGTGKTIASILGLKYLHGIKLRRLLFVTHRLSILNQAKEVYDHFFKDEYSSSILDGENRCNIDADFIFASSSTINKKDVLNKFSKDAFDFIIIDEVHRVGDNNYQNLINYFKPKFLLGMSATPDRSDGYSLYNLFNYNIAYEIRILDALKENMLTPFIYYGVKDITVNGELIDDSSDFNKLTCDERVKNIIENSKFYGFSGTRLKGLIFVSTIEIGEELEKKFNEFGYRTKFLSGSTSLDDRKIYIKMLEEENNKKEQLDYILTVDIFNEGVDIPSVNQIIFLRPTQSSIIFLQQLGRGLRKYENKENTVVLDFIGNYKNNFMITKALCKKSATKEELIKVVEGILPGSASIYFDKIAKEEIFKSIYNAKLNDSKNIFEQYKDVKGKLGHIPTLVEFEKYSGESKISSRVFLDMKSSFRSYYEFLFKKEEMYKNIEFNKIQSYILEYFGSFYFNGIRKKDIDIFKTLLEDDYINLLDLKLNKDEINYYEGILNLSYNKPQFEYENLFIFENNSIKVSYFFKNLLKNNYFKDMLEEEIEYAYYSNKLNFNESNDFVLFERYQRKDVSRIILKPYNIASTVYGYQYYKDKNVCPIFIDYQKREEQISYNDYFINKNKFHWNSRKDRASTSGEIKELIKAYEENKVKILLFVQKSSEDGFYYLGECKIIDYKDSLDTFLNKGIEEKHNVVHFNFKLLNECRSDVYNYLTSDIK